MAVSDRDCNYIEVSKMFSFFRFKHTARAITNRRIQPRLEVLDDRLVPSAPTITSLSGEIIGDNIVVFGQESDNSPAGSTSSGAWKGTLDTVTISGAINQTTTINDSGQFAFVAPYSGNGNVVVYAQDALGDQSSSCMLSVTPSSNPGPVITLQVVNNNGGSFTLSGRVFDSNPASLAVNFSGTVSATTTTDSQGNFAITVQPSQLGMVYATTSDSSGSTSNTADIVVRQDPPVIQGFNYTQTLDGVFVFTGTVVSPTAPGSTVTLVSSDPAFNGAPGTVGVNGTFTIIVIVPQGSDGGGSVGATTTDQWGQVSNSPSVTIFQ